MCTVNLVILGIFGGVFAFTGFNLLQFVCFNNPVAMRTFLAICAVSALFDVYALLVFRPFKGLK